MGLLSDTDTASIVNFSTTIVSLRDGMEGKVSVQHFGYPMADDSWAQDLKNLTTSLEEARLFSIHREVIEDIKRLVTEENNFPPRAQPPSDEEIEDAVLSLGSAMERGKSLAVYANTLRDLGRDLPFPKLPFKKTAVFYGRGVPYDVVDMLLRFALPSKHGIDLSGGLMQGHIFCEELRTIWEISHVRKDGGGMFGAAPRTIYEKNRWDSGETLMPWVLNILMKEICDKPRTSITPQIVRPLWSRLPRPRNKKAKESKEPPAFYPIFIDPVVRQSQTRGWIQENPHEGVRNFTHRWDVAAFQRIHVTRGTLPLDAEMEAKFRKGGYKVFLTPEVDAESKEILQRHDHEPPEAGEWLVYKLVPVKPHVRGPKDKPYIPAVRVLQGERHGSREADKQP